MTGLLIGAPASGSGKTTVALALICALRSLNIPVRAAKTGPDFLDAAWLAKASAFQVANFDAWMCPDSDRLVKMAQYFAGDNFLVVEGAMGLYDGAANGEASGAALANLLDLPVLLLLNVAGMGQSVAALARGFLAGAQLGNSPRFCGIICVRVGSQRHREILAAALQPVCAEFNVPLLGFLPTAGAPKLPSRHLGLIQACESEFNSLAASKWFTENCDLNLLLQSCSYRPNVSSLNFNNDVIKNEIKKPGALVIAIARDEAFAFCYGDLPELLREFGAQVIFFSPLRDREPPACDGVYLPGGYPELFMEQLAANASMRESLQNLAQNGVPIYGECGGYIYLCEAICDCHGKTWPMLGLLSGQCRVSQRLASLGYRKLTPLHFCNETLYGHEFHYGVIENMDPDCGYLWQLENSSNKDLGLQGQKKANVAGSWTHLYTEGSRPFWQAWLQLCKAKKRERNS